MRSAPRTVDSRLRDGDDGNAAAQGRELALHQVEAQQQGQQRALAAARVADGAVETTARASAAVTIGNRRSHAGVIE